VDELYEQYQKDRNAVDPAWWDFFEGYKPGTTSTEDADGKQQAPPGGSTQPAATPAPSPAQGDAAPSPAPAGATAPSPSTSSSTSDARTAPEEAPAPARQAEVPPSPVATAQPTTAPYAEVATLRSGSPDVPAVDDVQKLRGPAARVVTNMES